MRTGVVDQDIRPYEKLREGLAGALDLDRGIDEDEEAVIRRLEGANVLITTSRVPVTERVLALPSLELVGKIGTGIDNVDLEAARCEGVTVTYTPGLNALSVAEHTLTLILAVARRLPASQNALQAGGWRDEAPIGTQLSGSTVGIVGFGNVGRRVARVVSGLNATVLAYDPYVPEIDAEVPGAELTSLERVLGEADIVTVNAELTDETRHMIGADELDAMKPSAILVNTARGPIIDEDALLAALREGAIDGAGLDVFETEPLPPDSPFHGMDNVVTTPHIASQTAESRDRLITTITDNILRHLRDEEIPERYLAATPE